MDRNWVKNETYQNFIFPSSIDASSLMRCFQVTFSPFDLIRSSELRGDKISQVDIHLDVHRSLLKGLSSGENSIVLSMVGR